MMDTGSRVTGDRAAEEIVVPTVEAVDTTSAAEDAQAQPKRGWSPPRGGRRATFGYVALAILGVALILYAWRLPPFGSTIESTENAYVRGQTTIIAPQDGRLGEVPVRLGQLVSAGTQLTSLVPRQVWISANFKESQTARMAPGQPATVRVDALGGAELRGTVERIAPAAGSEFSVIRPDNATGNFVKVAQRITVRIALDPRDPLYQRLRPGMSVEARVDTAARR